jgi:ankyrin repeat protein
MPVEKPRATGQLITLIGLIGVIALVLFGRDVLTGNSKFYYAIAQGDEARVLELIKAGTDPNSSWGAFFVLHSSSGIGMVSPLHYALWRGEPKIAIDLVEAGADPNSRDRLGRTALIVAANAGHEELVRALLAKGADPRAASSSDGETPLRNGPKGPGGWYPTAGNALKPLKPEIRDILIKAGAK